MSSKKKWERIERLNAGEPIWYVDPCLDAEDEVWFYAPNNELRVSSGGVLYKDQRVEAAPRAAERHTLYRVAAGLYVDVEVRGDRLVLRRGVLNGASVATDCEARELPAILARYRAIGFRDGTPWNPSKTRVTLREYRDGAKAWTIHVDGDVVVEDRRTSKEAGSREAAIARAGDRIAAKERAGYALVLIELEKAAHPNPEPKAPKAAPARPTYARAPTQAKPADAFEAVDAAVAMLRDLHARVDRHHFIAECVDKEKGRARVAAVERHADFFLRTHEARVGRWLMAGPRRPRARESSWDYFLRVYGSITWIVDGAVDEGLPMFYCGNVTGGGWSCLEVADDVFDMDGHVEAVGEPALAQLVVFHGGWHHGLAFAFDTRVRSPASEAAIVPFSDETSELPRRPRAAAVKPFGAWLFARVRALAKVVERNIREVG